MPRPSNPLQRHRNRARGINLHHQVHKPDINSQLERSCRDQYAHLPLFQFPLRRQPELARQTTVMRRNVLLPNALTQMMRQSFRHAARIHEDQG